MDKFEIKTAFNRVKYDKKFDPGNMENVNDILYASPMQGIMEQIQDVIHQSELAHDNFIKECIVSVGIDPNALIETAKLNAELKYELKTLRAGMLRRADPWINVDERLPEEKQKVLLYSPTDGINIGHRLDEVGRFYVSKPYPERPTHWMPLPEPPKGE